LRSWNGATGHGLVLSNLIIRHRTRRTHTRTIGGNGVRPVRCTIQLICNTSKLSNT
jgi:hypothetical protein